MRHSDADGAAPVRPDGHVDWRSAGGRGDTGAARLRDAVARIVARPPAADERASRGATR